MRIDPQGRALQLPPLSAHETRRPQRLEAGDGPLLIGFGRAIAPPRTRGSMPSRARGSRLGVRIDQLVEPSTPRFICPDGTPRAVVSGVDVNASLAAEQAAGASGLLSRSPFRDVCRLSSGSLQVATPRGPSRAKAIPR